VRLFFAFLFLVSILSPTRTVQSSGLTLLLPGDEFILPPLFNRLESRMQAPPEGLKVEGAGGKRRQAMPGEWFDYGDTLNLTAPLALEVEQSESLVWVGGGVFQGTIGKYTRTQTDLIQYSVELKRGWIRVWIKPASLESLIRIEANGDAFFAREGEFWINAKSDATELYVVKGQVTSNLLKRSFSAGTYVLLKSKSTSPSKISENWDPQAMEVLIANAYPSLVKLATSVALDWESGKTEKIYSTLRKKGWRKAHRLNPDPLK